MDTTKPPRLPKQVEIQNHDIMPWNQTGGVGWDVARNLTSPNTGLGIHRRQTHTTVATVQGDTTIPHMIVVLSTVRETKISSDTGTTTTHGNRGKGTHKTTDGTNTMAKVVRKARITNTMGLALLIANSTTGTMVTIKCHLMIIEVTRDSLRVL